MAKKTPTSVDDLFARVAQEVAELGEQAMARVYPALQAAEEELEAALAGMGPGEETFTRARYRRQLAQLKVARRKYEGVADAMAGSLSQTHLAAIGLSLLHLKMEMEAQLAAGEFASAIESQINLKAAEIMSRGGQVPNYASSVRRYPGQVWNDINKQLQVSILKGETVHEATERILGTPEFRKAVAADVGDVPTTNPGPISSSPPAPTQAGQVATSGTPGPQVVPDPPKPKRKPRLKPGTPGETPPVPKAGVAKRYRHWAERLVRTETMGAYNKVHEEHTKELAKEAAEFGVGMKKRWDATNDMRVCKDCRQLHGMVLEVDQLFPTKRGRVPAPPAHPNCRCVLVSFVPGLDK